MEINYGLYGSLLISPLTDWPEIINTFKNNQTQQLYKIEDLVNYSIDNRVSRVDLLNHLKVYNISFKDKEIVHQLNMGLGVVDIEVVKGGKNKNYITNVSLKTPKVNVIGLDQTVVNTIIKVRQDLLHQYKANGLTDRESLFLLNGESNALAMEVKNGNKDKDNQRKFFYKEFNKVWDKHCDNKFLEECVRRSIVMSFENLHSLKDDKEFFPTLSKPPKHYDTSKYPRWLPEHLLPAFCLDDRLPLTETKTFSVKKSLKPEG